MKTEKIGQHCIACGYSGWLDTKHRLAQFILKNPPGQEDTVTPQKKYALLYLLHSFCIPGD